MKMRFTKMLTTVVLAGAIAATLAAASSSTPAPGAVVKVGSTGLGQALVNAQGRTLYVWAHDKGRASTCYGDCATYWPPLLTTGKPIAGPGANPALVGTTIRYDGQRQATYNGHPLYTFVQDTKPGQATGEGLTGFGGRWDPVSTAGVAIQAPPLVASVISPGPGANAGIGGTFSVNLALSALNSNANGLLSGYSSAFNDPSAPTFHPGPNSAAPGLVVLLSTTPTIPNSPLQGPNTNLAGVFQVNDVTRSKGLTSTFNSWIVTKAGFFGKATQATLTVYAVNGTAPAIVDGTEKPISNIVREKFTIAG
jgi:predicted lipoprotein with Yx(FWY)xxD motif